MAIKFGNMARPKAASNVLAAQAQIMIGQAVALHQQGQMARAQVLCQNILKMQPGHLHALHLLGVIALQTRNYASAVGLFGEAIAIKPDFVEAYCNRGNALRKLAQFDAAVASYDKAIVIEPDHAIAYCNRGNALQDLKQFDAALASYDQAIAKKPDFAEAFYNRGNALIELQQFDAAAASYDKAIAINPNYAEAYYNRGLALQDLQQLDGAVASYDRALAINPDYAEACFSRGHALHGLQQFDAAVASYDKAIAIKPDYAEAYYNRGLTLQTLQQLSTAVASYDKAIAIKHDFAEAYSNRGNTLKDLRQLDAAIASYDKAIAIKPDYFEAYENRLFCLSHSLSVDARQLYAEHLAFGKQFEAPLRADWQPHSNVKDSGRCLQVGFVSGDLSDHAVAHFLEPVLEFLAKKSTLSIHAYDTHSVDDEVSRRLRTYFAHWHAVDGLSDGELANKIRADRIDILIDLSGHTAHNRLLTFARKPAPIQVTWIGYPGTTGLQAMDYLLCDRFWIPQELTWQLVETPAYLPVAFIFKPSPVSPPISQLPALNNGHITFGSFNRASKITAAVIALWSSLLRRIPTARMAIGAVTPDAQHALTQSFLNEGIAPNRLTFFARTNIQDYLGLYHQIDICLDTFPYGGGTTTLHAAWMAVPMMTLIGETLPSRAGSTLINQLGLNQFIATSNQDFVSKGCYWAEHIDELATLRLEMRTRFNESAMGQAGAFSEKFEAILRTMWQRWCCGLPPTIMVVNASQPEPGTTIDVKLPSLQAHT